MLIRTALVFLGLASSASAQAVVIDSGAEEHVGSSAEVLVPTGGVEVRSGGSLRLRGDDTTNPARMKAQESAGFGVLVKTGGSIDLNCAVVENLTTLTVQTGATVQRVKNAVFSDLSGFQSTAPWIDLSGMGAGDRENLPFSFNKVSFVDNQTPNDRVNIKAGASTPLVRLLGNPTSHGNTWGESFDDDTADRVLWHSGAISRNGGATFDTISDALLDSGTSASSVITVNLGSMAFIDERIDFKKVYQDGASPTGPTVRNACLAPDRLTNAPTVGDSDSGDDERGVIVNCVVARGNVSETTATNCTFFWPVGSPGDVSYVEATNLLVQSGYTGTGNGTWTTSITNASGSFFVDSSSYNFHLARTGGDAAIDEGTTLTADTDFDGESRGNDGKPGGSGTWDIGADELHVPTITWGPGRTRDATPRITGTGIPGATVAIYRNGQFIGTAVVQGDGTWSFEDPTAQGSGDYTYTAGYWYGGLPGYPGSNGLTVTVDVTPPPPPTNVRTTAYNGCIDVSWDPVDSTVWTDFAGYQVWRRPHSGGAWAVLHTGLVVGTKYRDSTVVNGTAYDYKVTSSDNAPLIE